MRYSNVTYRHLPKPKNKQRLTADFIVVAADLRPCLSKMMIYNSTEKFPALH